MSRNCITCTGLVLAVTLNGLISIAGWSIDNPQSWSSVNEDDDLDCDGTVTNHPSTRWVGFGTDIAGGVEQHVTVSSQETAPGMGLWTATLLCPQGGWNVSPVDDVQMPIPDHECWVKNLSTQGVDDVTTDIAVMAAP